MQKNSVSFFIPGVPVAKGRAIASTHGGVTRMRTPERTANYESLVSLAASSAMQGRAPLQGPLELTFIAAFPIPKGWSLKRLAAHRLAPEMVVKRPDIDNLVKSLADGMNGIVYADDCQIASLSNCLKLYGEVPGVQIQVRELLP